MNTIEFYKPLTGEVVGEWRLIEGAIYAEPRLQSILDAALRRGSAAEVWDRYAEWSNGYLASRPSGPESKAFDGDGDGFINDGTPQERLAAVRFVRPQRGNLHSDPRPAEKYQGSHREQRLASGTEGTVTVHKSAAGTVVTKEYRYPTDHRDAEVTAALVAEALGINAPRVDEISPTMIAMDYVDVPEDYEWSDPGDRGPAPTLRAMFPDVIEMDRDSLDPAREAMFMSDGGYRIALFDMIVKNTDRHRSNVLVDEDGNLVAIDHGYAFDPHTGLFPATGLLASRYTTMAYDDGSDPMREWRGKHFVESHDFLLEDIREARAAIESIRDEILAVGAALPLRPAKREGHAAVPGSVEYVEPEMISQGQWRYNLMMAQLDELERTAAR